jgi:hypothetical protein
MCHFLEKYTNCNNLVNKITLKRFKDRKTDLLSDRHKGNQIYFLTITDKKWDNRLSFERANEIAVHVYISYYMALRQWIQMNRKKESEFALGLICECNYEGACW